MSTEMGVQLKFILVPPSYRQLLDYGATTKNCSGFKSQHRVIALQNISSACILATFERESHVEGNKILSVRVESVVVELRKVLYVVSQGLAGYELKPSRRFNGISWIEL